MSGVAAACVPLVVLACAIGSISAAATSADVAEAAEAAEYAVERDVLYRDEPDATPYMRERCMLDVYYPTDSEGFATVIWFHAGGLTSGERWIPETLKSRGIAVVAVDYRLSPRVKAPAYIDDAAAATAWCVRNIERFGGDPDRVVVAGHSAGAYLASMVGTDARWLAGHSVSTDSLAGIAAISGHTATHFTVRAERGLPGTRVVIDGLAPLYHVSADAPPMLLITGDREREMLGRYEENAFFHRMMLEVGHADVQLLELDGYDHGGVVAPALPLVVEFVDRVGSQ